MKIIIETTRNGLHLVTKEPFKSDKGFEENMVFETEHDDKEKDALSRQEFLYDLLDILGWSGGRYDSHRLRISIEPGDKYEGETNG